MRRFISTILFSCCVLLIVFTDIYAEDEGSGTPSVITDVYVNDDGDTLPVIKTCYSRGYDVTIPIHGIVDGLGYRVLEDGTVSIVEYDGDSIHLVIPETIDGYTVTKINDHFILCSSRKYIESVALPETLTEIGQNAFLHVPLSSVEIPANVKKIGETAFYNNALTSVVFHEGLEEIGFAAFSKTHIEHLVLPESLKTIGESAFADIKELKSITIKNPNMQIGTLAFFHLPPPPLMIGYKPSTAYDYAVHFGFPFKDIRDYDYDWEELPDGTVKILAYTGQKKDITIPDRIAGRSVSEIGENAFRDIGASIISIPEGIARIGAYAFAGNDLENISFPSTLVEIGAGAFKDNRLKQLEIPEHWTEIPEEAFANNDLDNLTIPDTLQRVADRAFQDNPLREVWIMGASLDLKNDLFDNGDPPHLVHIFAEADSNGQRYALENGHTFTPWYRVFYHGNGHTKGELPVDSNLYFQGDQATVSDSELQKDRHRFIGWNDQPDGSGQPYAADDVLTIVDRHIHLYAIWEETGFAGGSGTQEDPYLIANADQLNLIRYGMDKHYKLIDDIDLSGYTNWEPIGMKDDEYNANPIPFTGTFDGNGHVISNLKIMHFDKENLGFFSSISGEGNPNDEVSVRNVGFENVIINGNRASIGTLAGSVNRATISNVYARDVTIVSSQAIGGLAGEARHAVFTNVFSENIMILAKGTTGGIVGWWWPTNEEAYIKDVYVTGLNVTNTDYPSTVISDNFGGIVGHLRTSGTVDVINGYWNGTCQLCDFNVHLGEQETDENELKQRDTFPDWNFETDWLLLEELDMLPALRVFHPVELDVRLVVEKDPFLPGDTAQIEVSASYKRLEGKWDITGSEAIQYQVVSGDELVDISAEGEVYAIAPGDVDVEVTFEGGTARLTLTVVRDVPDLPGNIVVPDTPQQGGATATFHWKEPSDWGIGVNRSFQVRLFDGNDYGEWETVNSPSWTTTLPDDVDTKHAYIEVKSVTERGESAPVLSDEFTVISTPPKIDLVGDPSMTLSVTDDYEEPGAIATDAVGTDLTAEIVITGEVLNGKLGEYTLTYTVEDVVGNVTQVTRKVTIINDVPPDLTLIGDNPYIIVKGDLYVDPGANAKDYFNEPVLVTHNASVVVKTNEIGEYKVTYVAEDSYGNTTTLHRLVHVIPAPPNIVGGAEEIMVSGAEPHAMVRLYDAHDQEVRSATADEHGTVWFTELVPGSGYYVIQTVDRFDSHPSKRVTVSQRVAPDSPHSVTDVEFREGGLLLIRWSSVSEWGTGSEHEYVIELWMDGNLRQSTSVSVADAGDPPSIEWAIPLDREAQEAFIQVKSVTEHGESSYVQSKEFPIEFPLPGKPNIGLSASDWTKDDVVVTIDHGEVGWVGVLKTLFRVNDGAFVEYTGPFTVTDEGETIIEAYTIDQSNRGENLDHVAQAVVRIDRTGPQMDFSINDHPSSEVSVVVTVTDEGSGLNEDRLLYMWSESSTQPDMSDTGWIPFVNGKELLLHEQVGTWYLHVLAEDRLGNTTYQRTDAFQSSPPAPPGGIGGGSRGRSDGDSESVISKNGVITIPKGRSGEVYLNDEIIIKIPNGAVEQELHLTIEKLRERSGLLNDQGTLVSSIFEISANITDHLKKPGSLSIKFDASKVGKDQHIAIFYADDENKRWVEVGGKIEGEWITAQIDHFGTFAVLAFDGNEEDIEVIPEQPEVTFNDIVGHWAEHAIIAAANQKLVRGYPDGTFKPDNPITRAEFTVMLVNGLQLDVKAATLTFTDQDKIGSWAKQPIALAVQAGIVSGYPDGRFRPDAYITREEMALMIAKALGIEFDVNLKTAFADDEEISYWAKGAVEAIRQFGIVSGRGGNRFVPHETATRAEAVGMLLRLLEHQDNF